MKGCLLSRDLLEFLIGYFHARGVPTRVEFRLNSQPLFCGRIRNQVDNHFMTGERSASPVNTDVTEHAMFNLVPFARPRWKMADGNAQANVIREAL